MYNIFSKHLLLHSLISLFFLGFTATVSAQESLNDLSTLSDSEETFSAQKKALDHAYAWLTYDYQMALHQCYSRFFVNYCVSRVKNTYYDSVDYIRLQERALNEQKLIFFAKQRYQMLQEKQQQRRQEDFEQQQKQAENLWHYQEKQKIFLQKQKKNEQERVIDEQRAYLRYQQKQKAYQEKINQHNQRLSP